MTLNRMFKCKPHLILFFSVALLYIPVLLFFYVSVETKESGPSFPVLLGDSSEYVTLARNIMEHRVFSMNVQEPFNSEYFRTPGYPLLIAAVLTIFDSYYAVIFVHIMLVAFISILLYKMGSTLMHQRAGYVAAFLYVINASTLFYALTVMSDIFFTFLTVFSVYLLFFVSGKKAVLRALSVGCLVGFIVLTRPIGIFLPLPFLFFYILLKRKEISAKTMLLHVLMFVCGSAAILFPWALRNRVVAGVWGISSLGAYNVFSFNIPLFLSRKNGDSVETNLAALYSETKGLTESQAKEFKHAKELNSIIKKYIFEDPLGFAFFHVSRVPQFVAGNSSKNMYVNVLEIVYARNNPFPDKTLLIDDVFHTKDFSKIWKRLSSQSFFPLEYVFWAFVLFFNLLSLCFKQGRPYAFLFFSLFAYFALLTGPTVHVRYRMPAEPFMFLSAVLGYYSLRRYLSLRKGHRSAR